MELQVNSRELHMMEEAYHGQHIHNCDTTKCQHQPCRNGGTCISDAETWFCVCPLLYSGKLCQFSACERNPCAHGATCVPKSPLEAVCLCPHGRQGLLCDKAITITRPRFSGLDEFGYSSYMAYPSISSMSYFYEFRLKLTFSNNSTAMKNNLILFSGQKGQGQPHRLLSDTSPVAGHLIKRQTGEEEREGVVNLPYFGTAFSVLQFRVMHQGKSRIRQLYE
ncbi:protein eyes shut homolog [Tachysurus ichikawai]